MMTGIGTPSSHSNIAGISLVPLKLFDTLPELRNRSNIIQGLRKCMKQKSSRG
jgi:hypothetical protein